MDIDIAFGYRSWIPIIWIQSNPDIGRDLQFFRVTLQSHFFTLIYISNQFRISIQQHIAQTPDVCKCLDSRRSRCSNNPHRSSNHQYSLQLLKNTQKITIQGKHHIQPGTDIANIFIRIYFSYHHSMIYHGHKHENIQKNQNIC